MTRLVTSYLSWLSLHVFMVRKRWSNPQLVKSFQHMCGHCSGSHLSSWRFPTMYHPSRYQGTQHSSWQRHESKNCRFWSRTPLSWWTKPPLNIAHCWHHVRFFNESPNFQRVSSQNFTTLQKCNAYVDVYTYIFYVWILHMYMLSAKTWSLGSHELIAGATCLPNMRLKANSRKKWMCIALGCLCLRSLREGKTLIPPCLQMKSTF